MKKNWRFPIFLGEGTERGKEQKTVDPRDAGRMGKKEEKGRGTSDELNR